MASSPTSTSRSPKRETEASVWDCPVLSLVGSCGWLRLHVTEGQHLWGDDLERPCSVITIRWTARCKVASGPSALF